MRLFNTFKWQQSAEGECPSNGEIIYAGCVVGFVMGLTFMQVDIHKIMNINGALMGFNFIYGLPALMHVKCWYFPNGGKIKDDKDDKQLEPQI